jgi:protein-L-isoaspartate(D-aspartate) O-methyltransferase
VRRGGASLVVLAALAWGCSTPEHSRATDELDFAAQRESMVRDVLRVRGIRDERVLRQMATVPRHLFVPESERSQAYADAPLPIGLGQTISQPYVVALMTEALAPKPTDRVLEVGTGSGYQAAVLSGLAAEVHTIEILEPLATAARARLERLGYKNVSVIHGDGYKGLPDRAPFDAILVTAAPDEIPPPLLEQLAPGGRLVLPVGPEGRIQKLLLLTKDEQGKLHRQSLGPVLFVPLTRDSDRSP